jgi:hypothetical protein
MILLCFISWLYSQKENTNTKSQTASKLEGEKKKKKQPPEFIGAAKMLKKEGTRRKNKSEPI